MKKQVLLLLSLMCFVSSKAQVPILTGLKAGGNISNVSNATNSARTDMYVGGFLSVHFSEGYLLQPELVYSRQGYTPDYDGGKAHDVHLNYLSLMVANKIFFIPNSGLHVVFGPAFDFKLGKTQQSVFNNEVAKFDFGLFGGLGYEFTFGLGVEARFKHGLVDIFGRDKNSSVANKDLIANQVFQLGITYHFNAN
ncbi:PorT family protein [Flavobacteriaceae bacterium F08102]|nr:PorT family protein [Flavobacteriaceae bacterium F08102]